MDGWIDDDGWMDEREKEEREGGREERTEEGNREKGRNLTLQSPEGRGTVQDVANALKSAAPTLEGQGDARRRRRSIPHAPGGALRELRLRALRVPSRPPHAAPLLQSLPSLLSSSSSVTLHSLPYGPSPEGSALSAQLSDLFSSSGASLSPF